MARETVFTPEIARQIIDYVKSGGGVVRAAEAAGVSRQTVYNWRRAGRAAGEGRLYEFDREITKERAVQIMAAEHEVKKIAREGRDEKTRLNASMWLLERCAPNDYSQKQVMEAQIRQELAIEMVEFLNANISAGAFQEVITALAGGSGPAALPTG